MEYKTAVQFALAMSGKYNIPGKTIVITGTDAFGDPVTETIPAVDTKRLEKDAEAALSAPMEAPQRDCAD